MVVSISHMVSIQVVRLLGEWTNRVFCARGWLDKADQKIVKGKYSFTLPSLACHTLLIIEMELGPIWQTRNFSKKKFFAKQKIKKEP